jgi:uncharacterized protein
MEKPRLNVVTLGVSDFARAVRFYEALGFERRLKATGDDIAFFDGGGMVIGLFRWDMLAEDAQLPREPRPQAFRGITLAQMCRTDAEVDELMARALKAGAALLKTAQNTHFGGYSGYFADPDGHLWEVAWNPFFPLDEQGHLFLPDHVK